MEEDSISSSSVPTVPQIYNFQDPLSLFAAVLVLIIGSFGVVTNWSIIWIFYQEKSERTSFNLICVFRAASNVIILTTSFLAIFFIKTVTGFSIYPHALESWLIHLSLSLYLGNEYQVILIAGNRFCSLFLPRWYPLIWRIVPTLTVLTAIYLYRVFRVIYEMVPHTANGCYTLYYPEALSWGYDPQERCKKEDDILDVILYTFVIMSCVNVVTFLKIINFYWSRNQTMDRETRKRIRRNAVLFFQTLLQDSLYLIDLTFTFKLSLLSTDRFWTFISGTLVWECLHSIDGFIMIMFNERLSFLKKRFQPTPSVTVTHAGHLNTISVVNLPSVG